MNLHSIAAAIPEIYLTAAICLVLLFEAFVGSKRPGATGTLTLLMLVIGAAVTVAFADVPQRMVLFALANTGLPGTSGFVGEFLVILASFKASFWYAALAAVTLILGAGYTLWLVKRVVFGPIANEHVAELHDINGREFLILGVLALAVLLLGVWPEPLLKVMEPSIQHLVSQAAATKIPV